MSVGSRARPAIAGGIPVRDSFLIFGAPQIGEAEIAEVVDTLRGGWIGFGPRCLRFERDFAEYVQAPQAVSLSSCTAALQLALVVAGIGPGDQVITSPITFSATVNAIELVGARPVFVDVSPRTQNLDPALLRAALTERTRAVIPVHMAGRPCDMDAIGHLAASAGLTVIEDAAHAVEAAWNGRKVGSISDFTAFSFYATKNMTTGEGGMLTTGDAEAADRVRTLRLHGLSRDAWARYSEAGFSPYDTVAVGYKYNLTDLQAALGIHQLQRLEENLLIRERHWRAYDAALAGLEGVTPPAPPGPAERHARHLYTVLLDPDLVGMDRRRFVDAMKAENIGVGVHFTPVHLHSYYRERYGFRAGQLPQAELIGARTVSLPLSAALSDQDVADVVEAVVRVVKHHAG